jgi:hypothetical protein
MGPFARALIEGTDLLRLPLVSLFIFALTFAAVALRARRMDPNQLRELAAMPLDESEEQS